MNEDPLSNLKVFTLKPGLPVFHITKKNLPMNFNGPKDSYLQQLKPGEATVDLNRGIFLSLDEYHTLYYDAWDRETNQWASAHLKGKTTDF